jgi:hypothetical protein
VKNTKNNITHVPRPQLNFDDVDFSRLASKEYQEQFHESKAYKKHVKPALERQNALKKQRQLDWWKNNYWNIINTLIAVAAMIIGLMK